MKKRGMVTALLVAGAVVAIGVFALRSSTARAHCPLEDRAACEAARARQAQEDARSRAARSWNRASRHFGEGLGYWLVHRPSSAVGPY